MYSLIRGIDKKKFRIFAVCPNDGPYFSRINQLNINIFDLSIRSLKLINFLKLFRIVKSCKVDIIHSHGKGAGIYSRIIGFFSRVPVVHTSHGIHYNYGPIKKRAYLLIERLLSSFTKQIICVSKSERRLGLEISIFSEDKSVVISNGIDLEKFKGGCIDCLNKRRELGLSGEHIPIGTIGRFNVQKGYEYLIRAIPIVTSKYPNVKFLIVGGVPKGDEKVRVQIESLIEMLNVNRHVIITGPREDIAEIMKCFEIYVQPSLWEGLPITLLEAMACCKPVVATDVIGNRDVVFNGVTGLLAIPKDPEDLARKIIDLIQDDKLRKQIGYNARKMVESFFSIQKMIAETESLYESIKG